MLVRTASRTDVEIPATPFYIAWRLCLRAPRNPKQKGRFPLGRMEDAQTDGREIKKNVDASPHPQRHSVMDSLFPLGGHAQDVPTGNDEMIRSRL
jgi:hypothetical protein